MIKQSLALVALSIVIIFTMSYAEQAVHWLMAAHTWVSTLLTDVFSGGQAGNLARGLITLLALPILISLVPAVIYWAVRRHWFPYFMEVIWIVWLVQAGALLVMSQT